MKTMDYPTVKTLLERYFRAETEVAEERLLRRYFTSGEVDPRLAVYRPLFSLLEEEKDIQLQEVVDEQLRMKPISAGRARRFALRSTWVSAAAAVLLLLLSLWWAYPPSAPTETTAVVDWSKYEIQDEEEAMRLTREALQKVARSMNKGAATAAGHIDRVQEMGKVLNDK